MQLTARVNRTGDELTEIRFMLPRPRMEVLDALAIFETRKTGEFVSRRELCERVINEFINELFIKYHQYWLENSPSKEGKLAHQNAMFIHIRKRSKKQISRMESKRGIV